MNLVFHISEDDSEINFVFMFSYYYSETANDQCLKGPICMYSDSASLISFEIDCFYSLSTRTYQLRHPTPSITDLPRSVFFRFLTTLIFK